MALAPAQSSPPQTLGTLIAKLQRRLGFGASGAAAGVNRGNLESILEDAQLELYDEFMWSFLDIYVDKSLGVNQNLLNYPTELNQDRIYKIARFYSTAWKDLDYGIETGHYTTMDTVSVPARYQFRDQIEFWPKANGVYPIRVFGIAPLNRFSEDGDYATVDSNVLFLYALATAKAHYKQPDAALISSQWERKRARLRGNGWKQRTFGGGVKLSAGKQDLRDTYPWPKPTVVP